MIGLMLLMISRFSKVGTAWYWCLLAMPVISLVLELKSTRVLYVRLFELVIQFLISVSCLATFYRLYEYSHDALPRIAGVLTLSVSILLVTIGMRQDRNSEVRSALPCGWDGELDVGSGIVNPNAGYQSIQHRSAVYTMVGNFAIVMISLMLIPVFVLVPWDIVRELAVLLYVLWVIGNMILEFGKILNVIGSTVRWEQDYGMKIRVMRGGSGM